MKAGTLRSRFVAPVLAMVVMGSAGTVALLVTSATPAAALTTITVDKAGDTAAPSAGNCPASPAGTCTLRDAFEKANATSDDVQILVPAGLGPFVLTTGDALVHSGGSALTLSGTGGNPTISQKSSPTDRVIDNPTSGLLTVEHLTITGGNLVGDPAYGGGIHAGGSVTLTDATVSGNTAHNPSSFANAYGGGIYAGGSVTSTSSTVSGNTAIGDHAEGGGIYAGDSVTSTGSTVSGNEATTTAGVAGAFSAVGGGIFASSSVELNNSTVSENTAVAGVLASAGGIYAKGSVTSTNSTVSGNTATSPGCFPVAGGGIDAQGAATLTNSTVSGNTATSGDGGCANAHGGGISTGGSASLTNSTVSGNTATSGISDAHGGGISTGGSASLTNSTVSGNTVTGSGITTGGGGIFAPDIALVYATVVGNSAPTGANIAIIQYDSLTSFGSVVALPLGNGANCAGVNVTLVTISHGYNFSDDTSCSFTNVAAGDTQNLSNNPLLGVLADNGGPTQTRLPGSGSPLVDAIPSGDCHDDGASAITADQRDVSRPQLKGCDIGAVEVQGAHLQVTKVVTNTNGHSVPSAGYSFAVTCSDGTTGTLTVNDATNGGTSGTVDDIVPGSTCTVVESSVAYTNVAVVGQPAVTYDPATPAALGGEQTATVTVTNDYSQVNLLGEAVVQPKFTG